MRTKSYKMMAIIGVLTALSVILSFFKIPIIPPPFAFLSLEFADVPVIVSLLLYGPVPAAIIAVLKNVLSLVITDSIGVGELANLILDFTFILGYFLVFRKNHQMGKAMIVAVIVTFTGSILFNFTIFIPIFKLVGMYPEGVASWYYVAAGIGPLNLIKWPFISVLAYWLQKPLKKIA